MRIPLSRSEAAWRRALQEGRLLAAEAAQHPECPKELLCKLAQVLPEEVVQNPVWPLMLLEDPTVVRWLRPQMSDLIRREAGEFLSWRARVCLLGEYLERILWGWSRIFPQRSLPGIQEEEEEVRAAVKVCDRVSTSYEALTQAAAGAAAILDIAVEASFNIAEIVSGGRQQEARRIAHTIVYNLDMARNSLCTLREESPGMLQAFQIFEELRMAAETSVCQVASVMTEACAGAVNYGQEEEAWMVERLRQYLRGKEASRIQAGASLPSK